LSFLGNITGLFPGTGAGNLYQGLTAHSMILAPIASVIMVTAVWQGSQSNINRKVLRFCIALILICLYTILLAGSRGALIGGVLASFVLLLLVFRRNFNKLVKLAVVIALLLIATASFWSTFTANIDKKNQYAKEQGDNFASRSELWSYRFEEFLQSPVIGIGFASANKGAIDKSTGQIEPGTSWGVLFAQLGIFGALPVIILFIAYFRKLYRSDDESNIGKLLFGMLLFFTIHMIVEGYILASGSFLFFYVWLVLGTINNRINKKDVIVY
jgi:O-antigen ligase